MVSSSAQICANTPVLELLKAVRQCAKCFTSERYKDGKCKVCARARVAACTAKNPCKKKEQSAAWYAANTERIKALHAEWKIANPEKIEAYYAKWLSGPDAKATRAKWRAENTDALRIHYQNRRARKKLSGGKLSLGLAQKLFALQRGMCPCCSKPLGDDYHLDHVTPLALGGAHVDQNIQLLRAKCNLQKNKKDPVNFMQSRGFLL